MRCVIIHFHLNFRTGIGGHRGCPNGIRALHGDNFLRRAGIRPCAIVVPVVVLAFPANLRRQEALVRVEVVNPLQQFFRLCAGGRNCERAAVDVAGEIAVNLLAVVHQWIKRDILRREIHADHVLRRCTEEYAILRRFAAAGR